MKINPIFEKHLEAYRLRAFEVYRLSHTSPDVVFEWLREQKPMFGFLGGADPDIVDMLIKRDEPLINLGLALYATIHDDDHALNLYRNGDTTIKRAMLTGPSVGLAPFKRWINADSETLRGLLQSFDDNPQLLGSLFSNESIDPNLLVLLYERQEPFNELTDEQWILAITATAFNPIFSRTPRTSDDWERKRALEAAWKLFEVLPVNAESARILSRLGCALSFFSLCCCGYHPHIELVGGDRITLAFAHYDTSVPDNMDVPALIEKWKVDESAYEETEISYFRYCRFALRSQLEYEGNMYDCRTPDAIRKAYEKDKEVFLNAALASDFLYTKEELRGELRHCCYQHDSESEVSEYASYSDCYDSKRAVLQLAYPEWFIDSDDFHEMTLDGIEDVRLRSEIRLERLEEGLKSISQKMQELIEEQTSAALSQIYKAILWVMVIIIIGLIAILTKLY